MNKYVIGIVDESQHDIEYIERTIIINKPEKIHDTDISFEEYKLEYDVKDLSNKIVASIINDIINDRIHAVIVDYKIIVSSTFVEGTEIFKKISETVPKFPLIILSNVTKDCYEKEFVDADKIYSKREFFKIQESYSQEKTLNIFRNMDNYIAQRSKLSVKLQEYLMKLENNGYSEEVLKSIVETETLLDAFCPQEQTMVEKSLDISDLKSEIAGILGIGTTCKIILIGAGNLGRAVATHMPFETLGFELAAIFDAASLFSGLKIKDLPIRSMDNLNDFCRLHKPQAAILCVPDDSAKELVARLSSLGIHSFWNFTHYDISTEYPDAIVENVHLSDSLMTLSYQIKCSL